MGAGPLAGNPPLVTRLVNGGGPFDPADGNHLVINNDGSLNVSGHVTVDNQVVIPNPVNAHITGVNGALDVQLVGANGVQVPVTVTIPPGTPLPVTPWTGSMLVENGRDGAGHLILLRVGIDANANEVKILNPLKRAEQNWDYRVEAIPVHPGGPGPANPSRPFSPAELAAWLHGIGQGGWELVHMGLEGVAVFKKPL